MWDVLYAAKESDVNIKSIQTTVGHYYVEGVLIWKDNKEAIMIQYLDSDKRTNWVLIQLSHVVSINMSGPINVGDFE